MRLLLVYISLCLCMPAWAQIIPAEQKKMQDDLKKLEGEMKKALNPSTTFPSAANKDNSGFKAPKKRTALLTAIPKKIFTAAEFLQYIKTMQQKFELEPSNNKTIAYIKQQLNYKTARELYYASILSWYGKKQPQAVYLSLKSVLMDPDNMNALNNLCAFLNMSGYPHKAIPILQYGLSKTKDSAAMLNNIGQAYYQLGDLPASSAFLSSCTRIEPYHIEANNTQGHIATANGNSQAATQFYENSLKGGYNTSAASQLGRMDRQPKDVMRMPAYTSYPETDDNIDFACLTIPTDVTQNAAFNARMQAERDAWNNTEDEYSQRVNDDMREKGMNMANLLFSGNRPAITMGIMYEKAGLVMGQSYIDYIDQAKRLSDTFQEWRDEWNKRYQERIQHACDGIDADRCCRVMRAIYQEKQIEFSQQYNEHCAAVWSNAKGYYNTVVYWMPFLTKQRGLFDRDLMMARKSLLHTAKELTEAAIITDVSDLCLDPVETEPVTKNADFTDPECNFSLKIPLGIGDFEINCEKLSLSGGEGIVGGVEYNFVNGQSTLSLGIGANAESGIVDASVSAQYFITFDGNLTMQDAGLKYSGEVSAGEINAGPLQFSAISAESSVTVGVNSGVTASTEVTGLNTTLFSRETNLYSFSDN